MNMTRRDLLRALPAISLSLFDAGHPSHAWAREPQLHFPTRPSDRLALTSYPFRAYMKYPANPHRHPKKPEMDLIEFARMAVREFNIHNINPISPHFRSTDLHYLNHLREEVSKAGVRFVDLGLEGEEGFFDPHPGVRRAAIEHGKKWIDVARVVGSPSVRPHDYSRGVRPNVDLAAQSLGELAAYGAKKNIVVNLENDNCVSEDPFFIIKVIEKVNNSYLRALPDIGNTLACGNLAYAYRGLQKMYEHAFNMSHVKNAVISRENGKIVRVDMARAFGLAKAAGYRGYFSMEWGTSLGDPFQGTRKLIKETLRYLSS